MTVFETESFLNLEVTIENIHDSHKKGGRLTQNTRSAESSARELLPVNSSLKQNLMVLTHSVLRLFYW